VKASFIGGVGLFFSAVALGQSYRDESSWVSVLSWSLPLLILVAIWLVIWRKIGFGKGGYRRFLTENQERMAQIEKHLGDISKQLERIASTLERSGR
jgi:ATP-dependent Zn protease